MIHRIFLDKKGRIAVPFLILLDVLLVAATLYAYALLRHILPIARAESTQTPVSAVTQAENAGHAEPADALSEPADSAVQEEPAEPVPEAEPLSWAEKFAEHFTPDIVETPTLYSSPDISIELSTYTSSEGFGQRWYVEDIYLTDISFFQTMTPGGVYSTAVGSIYYTTRAMNALAAINGDFAAYINSGYVIRNGRLRCEVPSTAEVCALYEDGTMVCYAPGEFSTEEALAGGAWQSWTFGPSLLDSDGHVRAGFGELYSSISGINPRAAIGYFEPGHYCFVVADGRQTGAEGFTLTRLASFMEELGCSAAYNLDGGASAQMMFNSELVNVPVDDGRAVNDMVIIRREPAGEDQ